ncbi:hypothetical protein F4776DRAFT_483751 [Hypoxylon sp. NC0597]|nr:hypothetical protein F4776DRAFT_483751 [Hypoxylon sp. NC0597]
MPYATRNGIAQWKCRYHRELPLASQSRGKRKREIMKGYGCPAQMIANIVPETRVFQAERFETYNHRLQKLDSTKIPSRRS